MALAMSAGKFKTAGPDADPAMRKPLRRGDDVHQRRAGGARNLRAVKLIALVIAALAFDCCLGAPLELTR